jgi:hypothetical protein
MMATRDRAPKEHWFLGVPYLPAFIEDLITEEPRARRRCVENPLFYRDLTDKTLARYDWLYS